MVYTFSVGGGPLTLSFEIEADSRWRALEIARQCLESYVDVLIVTPRAGALRSVCLRCEPGELRDAHIVDEWAGVTSCRPVGGTR